MMRFDLARIVAKKTGMKLDKAEKLILAFESTVEEALIRGDKIIYSNFGSFYTVHYPSKIIYHPKLGAAKKILMLPTNATKWMPAENIKKMVDSGIITNNITVHGKKKPPLTPSPKPSTIPKMNNALEQPQDKTSLDLENEIYQSLSAEASGAQNQPQDKISASETTEAEDDSSESIEIPIRTNTKTAPEPLPPLSCTASTEIQPENKIQEENTGKHVNIYEELMNDGSKVESTFGDAIRVPRSKSGFFGRFLGRKTEDAPQNSTQEKPVENSRVSLAGAGIFDNPSQANIPKPATPAIQPKENGTTSPNQSFDQKQGVYPEVPPITNLNEKSAIPPQSPNASSSIEPNDLPIKNAKTDEEIVIAPFSNVNNSVKYIDLSKTIVPKNILGKIPERIARKYKIVPINEENGEMIVAMIDPEDIEAREIVRKYVQEKISIRLTTEDDLNHILDQYSGLESELESAIETADSDASKDPATPETAKTALIESASDNAPAARIVTSLLKRAIREKASDIHIEPAENEVEIRYRLDGILKKTASLPKDIQSAVISRIKILSNLKIDEQRMPQDGRFSLTVDHRRVDFRISTMPVAYGEKVVMRVLDKVSGILTIEQLGIRGSGLEALKTNIEKSHGMTLVTGPTGSGKTTTLYALIERIYNETINIITLEDPIEYRMPGINQSQVNAEIDYTFASGLRSIVRQDPDVIMIGEIRDPETAEMAVHAALTGHIVLSTLHTNDSAGAAPRMMDMGVEPFLLTSSLNCVVGQRLARKLCEDCKEEVKPNDAELKEIQNVLSTLPQSEKTAIGNKEIKIWKGKGCKTCGDSGYKGRLGVYEVLNISEEIKEMILQKQSSYKIQEKAIEQGMVTMIQDGILKVIDGITSLEEVWRVIKE